MSCNNSLYLLCCDKFVTSTRNMACSLRKAQRETMIDYWVIFRGLFLGIVRRRLWKSTLIGYSRSFITVRLLIISSLQIQRYVARNMEKDNRVRREWERNRMRTPFSKHVCNKHKPNANAMWYFNGAQEIFYLNSILIRAIDILKVFRDNYFYWTLLKNVCVWHIVLLWPSFYLSHICLI